MHLPEEPMIMHGCLLKGHQVTVITNFPNHPRGEIYTGYENKWISEENLNGIKIVRVKTYLAQNSGTFKRSFSFYFYDGVADTRAKRKEC